MHIVDIAILTAQASELKITMDSSRISYDKMHVQ